MKHLRSWLAVVLAILILGGLAWTLSLTYAEARESLQRFNGWTLIFTVPLALSMLLASASSFAILVCAGRYPFEVGSLAVTAYVIAQPLKYLPGKIWGFAYQVSRLTEHIPWQKATIASINHALLGFLLSFFSLGGVLGGSVSLLLSVAGIVSTLLWIGRGGVENSLPKRWRTQLEELINLPTTTWLGLCLSVALEWGTYFGIWVGLLLGLDARTTLTDIVVLGTLYSGAWFISSIISIIPGGIGIREGGFILAGTTFGYSSGNLLAMAAILRLVFTLGEFFLLVLVSIYLSARLRNNS